MFICQWFCLRSEQFSNISFIDIIEIPYFGKTQTSQSQIALYLQYFVRCLPLLRGEQVDRCQVRKAIGVKTHFTNGQFISKYFILHWLDFLCKAETDLILWEWLLGGCKVRCYTLSFRKQEAPAEFTFSSSTLEKSFVFQTPKLSLGWFPLSYWSHPENIHLDLTCPPTSCFSSFFGFPILCIIVSKLY